MLYVSEPNALHWLYNVTHTSKHEAVLHIKISSPDVQLSYSERPMSMLRLTTGKMTRGWPQKVGKSEQEPDSLSKHVR